MRKLTDKTKGSARTGFRAGTIANLRHYASTPQAQSSPGTVMALSVLTIFTSTAILVAVRRCFRVGDDLA